MSGEFVKAGYLVKSPPEFKALVAQWHKRWFLLMDSKLVYPLAARYVRLEYYQSEQDAKRLADPKGVINLNSCTQVISREPIKGHKHVFDVHTEERVYHLVAESGEDKQEWVDTLNTLLFTEQDILTQNSSPIHQRRWSPPQRRADNILRRTREGSLKSQRPLSFTGQPSPPVIQRPLPPVPNGHTASKPPRQRPLPPTPSTKALTPPGTHEEQKSKNLRIPPPKPAPYRKPNSSPAPPTLPLSRSPPTPVDITGHYDVAPGRTLVMVMPSPTASKRILAVPPTRSPSNGDDDYSVLENANILTTVEDADMYSHLAPPNRTTSPPVSTSPRKRPVPPPHPPPHSKGVHTVIMQTDEEYSLLRH
ncbi:sesquipedalian-1-like isoform X2 [Halichondria panicea]|uniref:sesquipedalian-1-like isoform X2 n=1 Tax=Halichondria panicea TaxID=6063 RepID=UPI00312B8F7C